MQARIKVLKDVDKSNILPITHAKAVYVDEKNTLDKTLNNIESQIIQQRKTYAELKELIDNNKLIPGTQYVLIDYRTKYQQPTTNVIKEMEVEELILTASNVNTFEPIVFSPKYPSDTIWYDFNNNLCEDKTTERKGFILRRYDPISGNDAPQDWRSMLWARYKPDYLFYYKDGTRLAFSEWKSDRPGTTVVYRADNKLWMARNSNIPTSPTDTSVFFQVYPDLDIPFLIGERMEILPKIELIRGELVELPTFSDSAKNNEIHSMYLGLLHNNVFLESSSSNKLGLNTRLNTFYSSNSNVLETSCTNNRFNNSSFNAFSSDCDSNFLSGGTSSSFGVACDKNIISSSYNKLGNFCQENVISQGSYHNKLGNSCYRNQIIFSCDGNNFGNNCSDNILKENNDFNMFGNGCSRNTAGKEFKNNVFGNSCTDNTFGDDCSGNSIGSYFETNTIGYRFNYNFVGEICRGNTWGNYCGDSTYSNSCSSNKYGNDFKYNIVKNLSGKDVSNIRDIFVDNVAVTIERTKNYRYVYWYLDSANRPVYTEIP